MNGDEITTNKLDGTSETHKYRCIGTYQIGADETMTWGGETFCPAFDCEVYQATDDAGDFTYFFFRDDTMETTYHIEFRYGSDLAALQQYMKGQYAYWLAAGIDANADAETIDNVIALFCTENRGRIIGIKKGGNPLRFRPFCVLGITPRRYPPATWRTRCLPIRRLQSR